MTNKKRFSECACLSLVSRSLSDSSPARIKDANFLASWSLSTVSDCGSSTSMIAPAKAKKGRLPGRNGLMSQSVSTRNAGSNPANKSEDLPLPLLPMIATKDCLCTLATSASMAASRPKKSSSSCS